MQNKIIVGLIVLLLGAGYFTFSSWKEKRDAVKNEMVLLKENQRLQLIIADQRRQCGAPCQNEDFIEPPQIVDSTLPINMDDVGQSNKQTEPPIDIEQKPVINQTNVVTEQQNNTDEELKNDKCINGLDQNNRVCQRANSLRMPAKFADD